MPDRPTHNELWEQAGREVGPEDRHLRYVELMVEHGHLVANPPCPICGETFRHRHAFVDGADQVIRLNVFGHDVRG